MNVYEWKQYALLKLKSSEFYRDDEVFWLSSILNNLLQGILKIKNFYLDLSELELDNLNESRLNAALNSLCKGEPLEQIIGYTYFYGNKISVFPNVLIPRPDSELLVETVIKYFPFLQNSKKTSMYSKANILNTKNTEKNILNFLEIGVGSGALSIAIAKEIMKISESNFKIFTSDISLDALEASKINILQHDLEDLISIEEADLWPKTIKAGNEKLDLIYSNPPYIGEDELIDKELLEFEPKLALLANNDGLEFYERILADADKYLNTNGLIIFEHGEKQRDRVNQLALSSSKYGIIENINDLAGRPRISVYIKI